MRHLVPTQNFISEIMSIAYGCRYTFCVGENKFNGIA